MSCDDGLVMQLHTGVQRDYDPHMFDAFGPDPASTSRSTVYSTGCGRC